MLAHVGMEAAVLVVRRQRLRGPRGRWSGVAYYAFVTLAAAGCIALSLGPRPGPRDPAPQAGEIGPGGALLFGPDALEHAAVRGARVYVPRRADGAPLALRLAKTLGQDPEDGAARLALAPAARQALAGEAVRVEVSVAPLEVTTAAALEIGLESAAGTAWRSAALQTGSPHTVRLTFPSAGAGPTAVWLRPAPQGADYAYGVEIAAVRLARGGP